MKMYKILIMQPLIHFRF